MRIFIIILTLSTFQINHASELSNYLQDYKKTTVTNYSLEQKIIKAYDLEKLIDDLESFYNDTVALVRQKAYYLTYKKALSVTSHRTLAVSTLLSGCNDKDGGIVGQNLTFLKSFNRDDFNEKSIQIINQKIINHRISHFKDLVLLAGFVGVGKDILYQKYLDKTIPPNTKWYISLALARLGNTEQIEYCMNKIKALPVNDNLFDYILPDLIYIRQKSALDYCIIILNNDDKKCHSLNPDYQESMPCACRIIEGIAPVIRNFPVKTEATGITSPGNTETLLVKLRKWFLANDNYQIITDIF